MSPMSNKETKIFYVSIDIFNSLLQLEPLLSEQAGRERFCLDIIWFII